MKIPNHQIFCVKFTLEWLLSYIFLEIGEIIDETMSVFSFFKNSPMRDIIGYMETVKGLVIIILRQIFLTPNT
ncbi:MAG: hypothetical protein NC194_04820 [Prevotella sp.]|nr:hypothetical protein [Bacteroides sp.]MCM1437200.1 hypothetical protein [Prevotella sp.]